MFIEEESLDRLTDWLLSSPDRQEGDHELILEFVRTIPDGTWGSHWYAARDIAPPHGSAQYVVHLRDGLGLVVVLDLDGEPGVLQVAGILATPRSEM